MSFLEGLREAFTSPGKREWPKTDADPAVERLRQEVRQAETTNTAPALDEAWRQVGQFREAHPDKVAAMTAALTADALLPQLEIEYLAKEGMSKFGQRDQISPEQMAKAKSPDTFESALIAGLQKDFQHYTSTDGNIDRHHVETDLLNGMVHGPDFYPPMHDKT